jgi:7-cyano-7-deazaguanine synthase
MAQSPSVQSPNSRTGTPAVALLSGGLDSATCAAVARQQGFDLYALTFAYGQRHTVEVEAARHVAQHLGVREHVVMPIDLRVFGGSALTDEIAVPKDRSADQLTHGIPITYVPARNTIFLGYALAFAEVRGAVDIFIGVNAVDFSGYPDCRPVFIEKFEELANVATKAAVEGRRLRIHAPLIHMAKADIVRTGLRLGLDYSLTHSCYDPSPEGLACGACDSCQIRRRGFAEAGVPDPTRYV